MVPQISNDEYLEPLIEKSQGELVIEESENDHTSVTEITDGEISYEFLAPEGQSEQEEPQTKISFYPEAEFCEIPNRDDLSDEEYFLCFYSPDEIAWMNEEQNETADRMESGKKAKKSTPYRGLEAWTTAGQHQMNQRIFSCVDSVLDEQDKQWKRNKSSTRKIAKASKSLTKTSRKIALQLAKQDERAARKVYEEDLDGESDCEQQDEEDCEQPLIPLRTMILNSTIMKSKRKTLNSSSSALSLDGSVDTLGTFDTLDMSVMSSDTCDSAFWSLTSSTASVFDNKPTTPKKKKRKSKKKSAAREGKTPDETPAKTPAARRKKIKKKSSSAKKDSPTSEPKMKKVSSPSKTIKKVMAA